MPEEVADDPFYWDVERIVQELCSTNCTWDAPAASKMPDPESLAEKLREHEIDGETLLGMGESDESSRSLCVALGVTKIRHQYSIIKAIKSFKSRSPAWKKSTSADITHESDVEMRDIPESESKHPAASQTHSHGLGIANDGPSQPQPRGKPEIILKSAGPEGVLPREKRQIAPTNISTVAGGANSGALPTEGNRRAAQGPQTKTTETVLEIGAQGDNLESVDADAAAPKKKRRIAPTNTSTVAAGAGSRALPTEADQWSTQGPQTMTTEGILELGVQGEYLGSGRLSRDDILHSDPGKPSLDGGDDFCWVRTKFIPPARPVQVNRVLKQHLRRNNALSGEHGGFDPDSQDELLPIFGDSGDENDYDEETWREIEEETGEQMDEDTGSRNPYLSSEEVDSIIRQEIDNLKTSWFETKLPRHERKAYKMWTDARKHGTRGYQITEANRTVHNLGIRIDNLCNHMKDLKWARADKPDLQAQTASLEQSVFERELAAWIIRVLNSPAQPAKPSRGTKPTVRQPRPPKVRRSGNGDEEILTSSSEDGLDDFIVDDELADQFELTVNTKSKQIPISEATAYATSSHGQNHLQTSQGKFGGERADEDDTEMLDLTNNDEPPPYVDPSAIAEMGIDHWRSVGDAKRQVITMLYNSAVERRNQVLRIANNYNVQDAWQSVILPVLNRKYPLSDSSPSTPRSKKQKAAAVFTKLFDLYSSGQSDVKYNRPVSENTARKIESNRSTFDDFFAFLRSIVDYFPDFEEIVPSSQEIALFRPVEKSDSRDDEASDVPSDEDTLSPSKRRRRQLVRDQAAQSLRDSDRHRMEEQEARRKQLREKLKVTDAMSQDETRLIINETRNDEEGFIYVNKMIASRIKDHQIAGVRFMWDQVIAGSAANQGCLLAHTMGLGKTMQIITLLVAIAEAAASPDPSISSQIPAHLKESKTLVLCPAGLVDNWMDELLTWTPDKKTLGDLRKIESSQKEPERIAIVKAWASGGGVLVIGYPMFTKLAANDELTPHLFDYPNIIIGDEAHKLQNPQAKVHQAANRFRTTVRIAMTGSPLANNVEEYHSMINWVAPNYLGPLNEFKEVYSAPIKQGLWQDSDKSERRKALKMLKVLKETVAPKIHRATVAALRDSLPPKREFILYLKMTEKQFEAYSKFVHHLRDNPKAQDNGNTLFRLIGTLSLLLAHPKIFRSKLEQRKLLDMDQQKQKPNATDEEGRADLPADIIGLDILGDLLAILPKQMMQDVTRSYKMAVLVKILDEARLMREKVLVFSQYLDTLDYIENLCREQKRQYLRLDGSTAASTRQRDVKQFNSGNDEIYLISTVAGGVGLNIHGASRVVIFDYKFNPVAEQQAIGRAYRIGQTKPVYVYWLIFDGTFEKNLQNQAVFKLQLQSRVVDKKNPIARAEKVKEYCRDPVNVAPQSLDGYLGTDRILDAVLGDDGLSSHITSIDMTDTFNEEEPEEQLTAEEGKEVEQMIYRNQLRWQNPKEYKLLTLRELQEQLRSKKEAPSPSQTTGPATMMRPSNLNPVPPTPPGSSATFGKSKRTQVQRPTPLQSSTPVLPPVPHPPPRGNQVVKRLAPPQDPRLKVSPPVPPPGLQPNWSPPVLANESETNNLPVMGMGTGFRPPVFGSPVVIPPIPPNPIPQNNQVLQEYLSSHALHFRQLLLKSKAAHGIVGLENRVDSLVRALEHIIQDRHPHGLPLVDAWRRVMVKGMNPEIALNLLNNELSPQAFFDLQEDQILSRLKYGQAKGTQSTPNGFTGAKGDPNHLQTHMRRSSSKANGGARGIHAASDRLAVEAVAARRASQGRPSPRPDRLPNWAHEAVNKKNGGDTTPPPPTPDRRLGDTPDMPLTLDD